jgi:glutamyl-tRNA reductase
MPVLALGVSYRRAPVELLERLAFSDHDFTKAYRLLAELPSVGEGVILSTCNRVEVYAEVSRYHAGFQDLKTFLAESRSVDPDEFAEPLYAHYEDDAAEHLFGVAAGIDSMVTGEPQILAQVRQAFRRAEAEGTAGPVLSDLFPRAVRFGRRARRETAIGASPSAFVEAGAGLAEEALGGLAGKRVVVVGAGKMSDLAVRALRERGVASIRVVNRTPERAERLAARHGGTAHPMDELVTALADADLVVSSTAATEQVVDAKTVRAVMGSRPGRPLFLLDLAVPRDVDPGASAVPGVTLVDIYGLRDLVSGSADEEVLEVHALAEEEVRALADRRRAARLAPLIRALHERGESVRRSELRRLAARLSELDPREREAVEALTRRIVAKLLHDPVVRLKDLSRGGNGHARALAELFGVPFPDE